MELTIHSRRSWRARSPRPRTPQDPGRVRELFVHWPGGDPPTWRNVNTVAEEQATMRAIQAFHMGPERRWSDFAYSFAVFPSGRVYRGRGMHWVPAAQLGHNTATVAVVVFLGPRDEVTEEVRHALAELIRFCERHAGHRLTIRPHRAVTSTECPGPRLTALVPELARAA